MKTVNPIPFAKAILMMFFLIMYGISVRDEHSMMPIFFVFALVIAMVDVYRVE